MRFRVLSAAAFALFVTSQAEAQSTRVWKDEPKTFLGLTFDAPIAEQIPNCSKEPQLLCFQPMGPMAYLKNTPDLGFKVDKIYVTEGSGHLSTIHLSVSLLNGSRLLDALTTKYGPHTEYSSERYVSERGVWTARGTYQWIGRRIIITYGEGDLTASASISLIDSGPVDRTEKDAAARRAADKL